jgi:large subunit ribosomal protein L13
VDQLSYKTRFVSKREHQKSWYIIDAQGQTLGRLCTKVASILRGKHKPSFTPNDDAGDNVIILNCGKIHLTGNKWSQKEYLRYSGYPGGQKSIIAKDLNIKNPKSMIETAVKGMLPKSPLGKQMFGKLHLFEGTDHPHAAQKPVEYKLT